MIRIGIDLAKYKTGIAILEDNHCIFATEYNGFAVSENSTRADNIANCMKMALLITDKFWGYKNIVNIEWGCKNIVCGIEVANFRNMGQLTTEYNFYAGVITALLQDIGIKVKIFNHDEWYCKIGKHEDSREVSKETSKKYARRFLNMSKTDILLAENDNIADAINIATYVDKCLDAYDRHKVVKLKKELKKAKSKTKKERLLKEIKEYEYKSN